MTTMPSIRGVRSSSFLSDWGGTAVGVMDCRVLGTQVISTARHAGAPRSPGPAGSIVGHPKAKWVRSADRRFRSGRRAGLQRPLAAHRCPASPHAGADTTMRRRSAITCGNPSVNEPTRTTWRFGWSHPRQTISPPAPQLGMSWAIAIRSPYVGISPSSSVRRVMMRRR
jgi:hypothetical protein